MSYYAKIKKFNIANGEGVRTAIFFSGCDFHCKECFNPELWNPTFGQPYTSNTQEEIFNSINEHIAGLSILGGEPLSQYNIKTVIELCKNFKQRFPDKTIWLWSGYCLENLAAEQRPILQYIDVLVDGQFMQTMKKPNLKFRGSTNQRILYKGVNF